MKILHITSKDFGPDNIIGGIATVLLQQVKVENQSEFLESKIAVYTKDNEEDSNFLFLNNDEEEIYKWNPNIVIFHGFYYYHHYKIAKKLKKIGIKYYIKPHSSFSIISQKKSRFKKILARNLLLNNYVKNAAGLIYLNKEEKKQSIYKVEKSIIMANGIDNPKVAFIERKKDKLEFVYLGRIDLFHKGLDVLIKCLEKNQEILYNKGIKFVFYGYGKENEMNYFIEKINSISKIAQYKGEVQSFDKYRVLNQHDIFLLLSRLEGMPMAILESLACGKPCLITKETNFEFEILDNNCGWITKLDSDEILRKILEIYDLYTENSKIDLFYFNKCQKLAEEYYWDNMLFELEKKYLNL